MSGKRKSEATISAAHEEKKPKDSQSIIVHSNGATSTKTITSPTSVIQNSPQTLLNTTNSLPGTQQPKRIKATPLHPGQPIPPGTTVFTSGGLLPNFDKKYKKKLWSIFDQWSNLYFSFKLKFKSSHGLLNRWTDIFILPRPAWG
jgi:hypothetical protein